MTTTTRAFLGGRARAAHLSLSLSLVKCRRSIKRARLNVKKLRACNLHKTTPTFKKKTFVGEKFVLFSKTQLKKKKRKREERQQKREIEIPLFPLHSFSRSKLSRSRLLALSAGTSSHARSRSPFVVVVVLESVVLLLLLSSIKESICWDIRQQKSPTPARRRISNSCALIKKRKKR